MHRWVVTIIVLLTVAGLPTGAEQGEKGDVELGFYAGGAVLDDYGKGAGQLDPENGPLWGVRVGWFFASSWSLEFSAQQILSETKFAPPPAVGEVDFDVNSLRLNLLWNMRPGYKYRPYLTFGAGLENTRLTGFLDEKDPGYNVGGGFRWFLGNAFGVRLDGRYVFTDVGGFVDDGQDNVEGSFGLLWAFGGGPPADTDGDGVRDRRDKCPDTPRGAIVDSRGCPIDSDGDGVPDGIDRCPDTRVGVPVDAMGCPLDSDGDGVHDGIDECPDTPKGARVDARGCPTDADGDGVFDGLDKCPDTPGGALVDTSGCPRDSDRDGVFDGLDKCAGTPAGVRVDRVGCPLDSDGDGVFDGLDKCPGTPPGTKVDAKGCKVLFEKQRKTLVLEGVNFEFDSARLTPAARGILDRVAMSLKEWSEIRVEVAGHTDSAGRDGYNLTLSQRRAESVRSYLMRQGVDGARMTAKGYGETQPLADNRTPAGREKNRRVELKKLN